MMKFPDKYKTTNISPNLLILLSVVLLLSACRDDTFDRFFDRSNYLSFEVIAPDNWIEPSTRSDCGWPEDVSIKKITSGNETPLYLITEVKERNDSVDVSTRGVFGLFRRFPSYFNRAFCCIIR